MQGNGFLAAGQGTVQFPGQELPARAVRAVYFVYELVPGGVVEDLGQLLFPARRGVVGLGLLDALTEEAMQGFAVSVAQPDRILEQEIPRGLGARREVRGNL